MRLRRVLTLSLCLAGSLSFVINGGGCTCDQPPSGDAIIDPGDSSDSASQVFDEIQDAIDDNRDGPDGDSELAILLETFLLDVKNCAGDLLPNEDPAFVPLEGSCIIEFDTDGDLDIDEVDVIQRFGELLSQG